MIKRLFIGILLVLVAWGGMAQAPSFTGSAPEVVAVGEQFRISYKVNKSGKNFTIAAINNFNILMGPSTSRSISTQIIGGKMTTEKSFTYSYILVGNSVGTFTIPPAKITIKGKTYSSNPLTIRVVKTNQQSSPPPTTNQPKNKPAPSPTSDKNRNFFVRIILSKSSVYKGEHLIATIKIYSKYDQIGNLTFQPPTFAGFLSQEIKPNQSVQFKRESFGGSIYNTAILTRYVLFPQRSGNLTVGTAEVECTVRQIVSSGDFFDDFFGRNFRDYQIKTKSPSRKVVVKDLPPNKPANFSGGVGTFKLNATINKDSIQANEAITLNIRISGNGNLKLLKPIKLNFPKDFEVYDPEKSQRLKNSYAGTSGSLSYKYLLIPRFGGNYTIPSAEFSYFDIKSKRYKKLTTPKFTIAVAKSKNGSNATNITSFSKEDIKFFGSDIRFLKTKNRGLFSGKLFFGTRAIYLFYGISFLLFLLIIIVYSRILKKAANYQKTKYRKASKVARKRLQKAKISLKNYDKHTFYDNLLDALWGYTSDKFSIPKAKLSKDNIIDYLTRKNASEATRNSFIDLLIHCEYARYSPDTKETEMDKLYAEAIALISQIENELKK